MRQDDLFVLDTAPSLSIGAQQHLPSTHANPTSGSGSGSGSGSALSASTRSNGLLLPGHVTYEEAGPSHSLSKPRADLARDSAPGPALAPSSANDSSRAQAGSDPNTSLGAQGSPSKDPSNTAQREGEEEEEDIELGEYAELELDADDSLNQSRWTRYYEDAKEQQVSNLLECNVCGQTGHLGKRCPHSQCLACGALDDHTTRECPHGVVCFRCGQTGHRISDCPKPRSTGRWQAECIRCGSSSHQDKGCPTLWRVYHWNTNAEWKRFRRNEALRIQKERRRLRRGFQDEDEHDSETSEAESDMKLDSDDSRRESETKGKRKRSRRSLSQSPSSDWDPAEIWCYNCASRGSHWGDDCPERYNARGDPSAYSHFMSLAGPFGSMFASRAPLAQSTARTNEHIRFGESTNHAFDFDLGDGASIRLAQDPSRHAASIVDQLIDSGRATGRDKRARGPPSRRGRVGGGENAQGSSHSSSMPTRRRAERYQDATDAPRNARLQQREAQSAQQKQRERERERERERDSEDSLRSGSSSKKSRRKKRAKDHVDDWFDRPSAATTSRKHAAQNASSLSDRMSGSVGQKNKSSISNASAGKEQRRQRRRGEPEFGRFARADGAEHSRPASTFRPQFHGDY